LRLRGGCVRKLLIDFPKRMIAIGGMDQVDRAMGRLAPRTGCKHSWLAIKRQQMQSDAPVSDDSQPSFWDARAPIYLIESPSADDLYAGRNEGHSLVSILSLGEIEVNYFLSTDAERFERAVSDIAELILSRSDKDNVLPFIHISAHGSEEGIELTDGDCILWDRLSKLLNDLHNRVGPWAISGRGGEDIAKCSLSLSSCSAYTNYLDGRVDDLPIQSVLGPRKNVGWCQSLLAFSSFYYQAFALKQPFDRAVRAMNAASCQSGEEIFFLKISNGASLLTGSNSSPIVAQRFSPERSIAGDRSDGVDLHLYPRAPRQSL
jgi:hypothetical protein